MASLIRKTKSICPECKVVIDANYEEEDGQVFMVKECTDHGKYKDLISIDAKHFRWIQQYKMDSEAKILNPQVAEKKLGCPYDCGICNSHKSAPAVATVDVTYRCNLKCNICYANALTETGKNIEPTFEELRRIYQHFRDIKPQPPVCAMYTGGEPTMRDDLPDILRMTTKMGYNQRQVATNGIRFAKDIDFLQDCIDAGMNTTYLQFDGVGPEVYKTIRNADIWHYKQKMIENCRKLGFPNIILVPTIAKGINDDQVPTIIDYAIENLDVVSTISFQPVSLCGRVEQEDLLKLRYTSSHVIKAVNEYTDGESGWMYPMPALAKFAKVTSWLSAEDAEVLELTCDPKCGFGTFLSISKDNKIRDITKIFDPQKFIRLSDKWYKRLLKQRQKGQKKFEDLFNFGIISRSVGALLDKGNARLTKLQFAAELLTVLQNPLKDGLDNFIQRTRLFLNLILNSSRDASADWVVKGNNLLIVLMQFQDAYNLDLERTSRCLVNFGYIDPKTKQVMAVPFCTMNTIHRPRIEKELLMAQGISKEEEPEPPIPKLQF
ncbi:MAG: radical SAM protein [Candidatus Helarchaeota archaeon]|nr:radical SAM protein [Candidatus Helarchaeota archaeon]